MEYSSYFDAYEALVKDNDGVLPDLYEPANLTISIHPSNLMDSLTVADVLALAIVEMSSSLATSPSGVLITTKLASAPAPSGELVDLDKMLERVTASLN